MTLFLSEWRSFLVQSLVICFKSPDCCVKACAYMVTFSCHRVRGRTEVGPLKAVLRQLWLAARHAQWLGIARALACREPHRLLLSSGEVKRIVGGRARACRYMFERFVYGNV